jgi:hypothetical protein
MTEFQRMCWFGVLCWFVGAATGACFMKIFY